MLQPKSSKTDPSTSRRHKKQHTINETQQNHITVPFVPWVLLGSVPLFLWVPSGSVVPLGSVGPVTPLIHCFVGFRCSVGTVGFRCFVSSVGFIGFRCSFGSLVPLGSFVSLVSVVLLGSLVPLFRWVPLFSYKSTPTRHDGNTAQHNTTKQLKTKGSAAEAVACK